MTHDTNPPETPQTTPPNTETSNAAPTISIEEQLQQALDSAQAHKDAWLRAKAEGDNIRKRAVLDVANAHKYAIDSFATELLAVKDSLEAALSIEQVSLENLKSGVELTLKQLNSAFDKFHLNEINPAGDKFDPHRHQAISAIPSDAAPNTVVQVLQKGYILNDRVIRPALVTVPKEPNAWKIGNHPKLLIDVEH